MSEPIIIRRNKGKLLLLMLIAIVFTYAGYLFFTDPEMFTRNGRRNPVLIQTVGAVCLLFCGIGVVVFVSRLLNSSPALIIRGDGLVYQAGISGKCLIDWNDIKGFSMQKMQRQRYLLIEISNQEKYIREAGFISRLLMKMNHRFNGTPFFIPSTAVNVDLNDLQQQLYASWQKFRRKTQ